MQLAAPPGCEERAREFFGVVLGMSELAKPEALRTRGGVWFSCGAQQVHVGVEPDFAPARKAHPAFRVRGLEALRTTLSARGLSPREDDAIPGTARFFVDDPFGNRLEFMEAP